MQRHIKASSHVHARGFTVAELVLVIFILGILISLSVGAYVDYQEGARDRERKADIGIISQSIERYYRTNAVATGATYPVTTVGVAGLTTIIDNSDATTAPQQTSTSMVIATTAATQTPTVSEYIYQPLNVDGTLCAVAPCVKFKLYSRLEANGEIITQNSLRQQ